MFFTIVCHWEKTLTIVLRIKILVCICQRLSSTMIYKSNKWLQVWPQSSTPSLMHAPATFWRNIQPQREVHTETCLLQLHCLDYLPSNFPPHMLSPPEPKNQSIGFWWEMKKIETAEEEKRVLNALPSSCEKSPPCRKRRTHSYNNNLQWHFSEKKWSRKTMKQMSIHYALCSTKAVWTENRRRN